MILGVIDCGTNTFNLLIVKVELNNTVTKQFNTRYAVKLGEGLLSQSVINEAGLQRAHQAFQNFTKFIHQHKVEKVIAFGTSAIRDAINGNDFVQSVFNQYGIKIAIIDGNKEADLIYFGVRQAVKLNSNISLIMDIGGGSNEFILANDSKVFWKQSFKMGAARLLEKFSPSDPITQSEIHEIHSYQKTMLQPLLEHVNKFKPFELVGSSGAFDSIIEMIHGELNGEPLTEFKTEYQVNMQQYQQITQMILNSTFLQRQQMKGLVPMRLDMIVISCLMIDFILKELSLTSLRVSTYSLKEGALFDFLNS